MKNGFFCRMYGKDCFIVTNQTRRTNALAEEFINKVQNYRNKFYNITEKDIEFVKNNMRKATFQIRTIKNGEFAGLRYYEINGENFSWGCDACKEPMEYCILV